MGTDPVIYIKADGNKDIATGHLMRCLAIGRACRNLGGAVTFLVSDTQSMQLLQDFFSSQNEFPILCSHIAYLQLDAELPFIEALCRETKPAAMLVDSYFVTKQYLEQIRSYTKLVYLDDIMAFDYPVDLLINYDVIPPSELTRYQAAYQNAKNLLLGASYAPLRTQFQGCLQSQQHSKSNSNITHVLLTSGGSDPYNVLGQLLQCFLAQLENSTLSTMILHTVVGAVNLHKQELEQFAAQYSFIHLHQSVTDMASLMASMDCSISAAGTMLYELCAMGVPTISYTIADNQISAAKAFDAVEVIPYLGDIRTTDTLCSHLVEQTLALLQDPKARKKQSAFMHSLVDGNGAKRIASAILELK